MRQFIIFLLSFFSFFVFFPLSVEAHLLGQESFFKVNDIYTPLYHVPSTSLPEFVLPQDSAPESYLVNTPITFEIDTKKLPMISDEAIPTITFQWKFGDGETFEGLKTTHVYTEIGSYILEIYADDGKGAPVLMQSLLLNILPDVSYKLPKAVLIVNKKQSRDPLVDILSFSFKQPLRFDASSSTSSTEIVSYFWDFGDMTSSTKKINTHLYKDDLRIVFPVLRIKDKNGFISDAFAQINNTVYENDSLQKPQKSTINNLNIFFGGIMFVFLTCVVVFLLRKKL